MQGKEEEAVQERERQRKRQRKRQRQETKKEEESDWLDKIFPRKPGSFEVKPDDGKMFQKIIC